MKHVWAHRPMWHVFMGFGNPMCPINELLRSLVFSWSIVGCGGPLPSRNAPAGQLLSPLALVLALWLGSGSLSDCCQKQLGAPTSSPTRSPNFRTPLLPVAGLPPVG